MKIFLDFDDVIFNTKKLKKDLADLYFQNGITNDEFEKTFIDYPKKKGNCIFVKYSIEKQLEKLERMKGDLGDLPNKIKKLMADLKSYVFDDFWQFSKKFGRENIFVVSFGNNSFQKEKILASGIISHISDYKILDENKALYIKEIVGGNFSKEKVFLIDDRPEQLELAKEEIPKLEVIRMKRKEGRYVDLEGELETEEAASLSEAGEIIDRHID